MKSGSEEHREWLRRLISPDSKIRDKTNMIERIDGLVIDPTCGGQTISTLFLQEIRAELVELYEDAMKRQCQPVYDEGVINGSRLAEAQLKCAAKALCEYYAHCPKSHCEWCPANLEDSNSCTDEIGHQCWIKFIREEARKVMKKIYDSCDECPNCWAQIGATAKDDKFICRETELELKLVGSSIPIPNNCPLEGVVSSPLDKIIEKLKAGERLTFGENTCKELNLPSYIILSNGTKVVLRVFQKHTKTCDFFWYTYIPEFHGEAVLTEKLKTIIEIAEKE